MSASRPKCANANQHPAQILLNSTTKRCTSAQVKADNEAAAAAVATTALIAAEKEAATKARIAQLEDSICIADRACASQAMCPDLHKSSVSTNQVCKY